MSKPEDDLTDDERTLLEDLDDEPTRGYQPKQGSAEPSTPPGGRGGASIPEPDPAPTTNP